MDVDKKEKHFLGDLYEGEYLQSMGLQLLSHFNPSEWKSLGQLMEEQGYVQRIYQERNPS